LSATQWPTYLPVNPSGVKVSVLILASEENREEAFRYRRAPRGGVTQLITSSFSARNDLLELAKERLVGKSSIGLYLNHDCSFARTSSLNLPELQCQRSGIVSGGLFQLRRRGRI